LNSDQLKPRGNSAASAETELLEDAVFISTRANKKKNANRYFSDVSTCGVLSTVLNRHQPVGDGEVSKTEKAEQKPYRKARAMRRTSLIRSSVSRAVSCQAGASSLLSLRRLEVEVKSRD
jgi:hypothetical protein